MRLDEDVHRGRSGGRRRSVLPALLALAGAAVLAAGCGAAAAGSPQQHSGRPAPPATRSSHPSAPDRSRASTRATPERTDVEVVPVWTAGGAPDPLLGIGQRRTGQCLSEWMAGTKAGVWRCTAGDVVYDSCVPPAGDGLATEVACAGSLGPTGFTFDLIHLSAPLQRSSSEPGGGSPAPPWAIELRGGVTCFLGTGVNFEIVDGFEMYYSCGAGFAGQVDAARQPWTVQYQADGSSGLARQPVKEVWTIAAPPAGPPSQQETPVCSAAHVVASFAAVPGGNSAGHVIYLLALRNESGAPCTVSGLPGMSLLGVGEEALPTDVDLNPPAPAQTVSLAPGASAYSAAWFSPDVPGVGEPTDGNQCEPTAAWAQVDWSGSDGSVTTPVQPATPVCERGTLAMSELGGVPPSTL